MAALETTQPRAPLRAFSLFGVLVIAKICMFAGRDVAVLTLFWDDALIAVAFGLVEWLTRTRPRICTILYIACVAYAAINVPIARLTSSPLTLQMMRATGSALSDSITHHLTPANIGFMALIIGAGIALPLLVRRIPASVLRSTTLAIVAVLLFGTIVTGLTHSNPNAFTTLIRSSIPRVHARASQMDWRLSLARETHRDPHIESLRAAARGRNVVVITLESTGAQYLKPYGAQNDPTPNLTTLAKNALLFENAYAVYPESIKGLFSVLCSRYPAFDTQPADYARVRTPAIAEVARNAGYRTALFHSGRFMYLGMRSIIDHRGFEVLEDAGHIGGNHNSSFGVDEPSTVQRILQWIDCLEPNESFCLMYLPIAGHHPYEVPGDGPFTGNDERTRYLNALHYGDAALGELLRAFRQRGRDTNTLFVIYGDHSEAFGQHDGNFGHTFFLYEENVRVPLLIAAPGLIEKPTRITNIASLIDVAPTIVDLLGLAPPPGWQGISLLNDRPRTALFFTDYASPLVGIRDGQWKAICDVASSRSQLFDLSTAPCETRDIAARQSTLVASCRDRLESWAAAQKSLLKP
jgi:glucan phosphoethanolaminetransferase (alkaline phosphatase superfamily)